MRFFKLFFILILALSIRCNAQFTISGIVKDSISYKPLVGVSIKINQLGSLNEKCQLFFFWHCHQFIGKI